MVYVFFAHGFEEIEAITIVDILRRAEIEVKTVGINGKTITGAHGITVHCDIADKEVNKKKIVGIVLPGGQPGTDNLNKSSVVEEVLNYSAENNLFIAAICAAPMILADKGILDGKDATIFPGLEDKLKNSNHINKPVVLDNNILTGNGPAAAMAFSLTFVEMLKGKEASSKIGAALQCNEKI